MSIQMRRINLTLSRTRKIFLKRPIYKIPCKHEGCKTIIHTRSFNRKRCYKHCANGALAKYKVSKRTLDKRKKLKSPYDLKVSTQKRKCLKCGNVFDSVSAYNRVCTRCNNENDQLKNENRFLGWKLMRGDFEQTLKYYGFETSSSKGWVDHNV